MAIIDTPTYELNRLELERAANRPNADPQIERDLFEYERDRQIQRDQIQYRQQVRAIPRGGNAAARISALVELRSANCGR